MNEGLFMEIIDVTAANLAREHICCAISDKKGETCVASKKAWMSARFDDGLVFKKLDARAKVFIEYIPAENAWCPIQADGYMFINCLWVSGQFKGQGYANRLLAACLDDTKAKGKLGVCALSSKKKLPYLSDPQYLRYKGFLTADAAAPSYELLYLPFEAAPPPRFKDCAKEGRIGEKGMVLYYSNQCPHTDKYAPMIQALARRRGADVKLIRLETARQAQSVPAPFTTYSFFSDGQLVTHEIFSESKFEKFLDAKGFASSAL